MDSSRRPRRTWRRSALSRYHRFSCRSKDREIGDELVVRELIAGIGENPGKIVSAALDPEHSSALRTNTEEAMRLGIFGAPNCVIGEELFWGEESMEDAVAWASATQAT